MHVTCLKMWYDFKRNLKNNQTINSHNQKIFELEKKHWSDVTIRIIEIIKFLAAQSLPLRGSSDKLYQNNNGNFLKLIGLFGRFDSVMATHIDRTLKLKNK